ncbi:hypothetical protein [Candidatus Palauibacter sp.]|uniref:hypothetical protein n=1 Tax=Candidatus Palauibacter sp. TaxID=3101350 RepID=UPI003AF24612
MAKRSDTRRGELCFYWVASGGDRDEFAQGLLELSADLPLCPVVVRIGGFVDPNAVAHDLLRVLESAKTQLVRPDFAERIRAEGWLDVVLIARRELELDSTSSPVVLPDWFPVRASTSVTATIDDLTWSTRVALSAGEVQVADLRRLVFELDRTLVRVLRTSHAQDHRRVNALYDRLRSGSDGLESFEDLLSGTESTLNRIRNPGDYRPSVSRHPTLVGHIWRVTNATAPDKLPALAKSLAAAVGIAAPEAEGFYETMTMVLERPSQPIEDANVRWGFNFVVSVRAACQLITAAAHADEYAEYPVQLARSLSLDLRTSLDRSIDLLDSRILAGDGIVSD